MVSIVNISRKSTNDCDDKNTLKYQLDENKKYITRNNINGKITDIAFNNVSAYDNRNDYYENINSIIQQCKEGDILIFHRVDRFSRNISLGEIILFTCSQKKIKIIFTEQDFVFNNYEQDYTKRMNNMNDMNNTLKLMLVFSQKYSDTIRDNIKRQFENKKNNNNMISTGGFSCNINNFKYSYELYIAAFFYVNLICTDDYSFKIEKIEEWLKKIIELLPIDHNIKNERINNCCDLIIEKNGNNISILTEKQTKREIINLLYFYSIVLYPRNNDNDIKQEKIIVSDNQKNNIDIYDVKYYKVIHEKDNFGRIIEKSLDYVTREIYSLNTNLSMSDIKKNIIQLNKLKNIGNNTMNFKKGTKLIIPSTFILNDENEGVYYNKIYGFYSTIENLMKTIRKNINYSDYRKRIFEIIETYSQEQKYDFLGDDMKKLNIIDKNNNYDDEVEEYDVNNDENYERPSQKRRIDNNQSILNENNNGIQTEQDDKQEYVEFIIYLKSINKIHEFSMFDTSYKKQLFYLFKNKNMQEINLIFECPM